MFSIFTYLSSTLCNPRILACEKEMHGLVAQEKIKIIFQGYTLIMLSFASYLLKLSYIIQVHTNTYKTTAVTKRINNENLQKVKKVDLKGSLRVIYSCHTQYNYFLNSIMSAVPID